MASAEGDGPLFAAVLLPASTVAIGLNGRAVTLPRTARRRDPQPRLRIMLPNPLAPPTRGS
jgi:hypothetical protein